MQNLDVIYINLWQILISLANLVLLFLIVKFFLFKPVKNIIAKRNEELERSYTEAQNAETQANQSRIEWEKKLSDAKAEADNIINTAAETAKKRGENIISDAKEKADSIVRIAQNEVDMELKKAADSIKQEIVEVSGIIAEKMIGREINTDDHKALIDSFIGKIGENND